jgi:uracil-DNA glycosylase
MKKRLFQKSHLLGFTMGILLLVCSCSKVGWDRNPSGESWSNRGEESEYDVSMKKASNWPDLFAETPNYRAFGKAIVGGSQEKFRWKMGPMWYRGRLGKSQVRVFIIGQEGAQDENVSNRAFTGSTGTRMQKFINYFGINQSYLFMNTFIYTITGQYSLFGEDREDEYKQKKNNRLKWLAQSPDSIIVEHRHKLFDYMLKTNKDTLALVIGVGTAGKESAANWAKSHGANCGSWMLSSGFCEGAGKLKGVKIIGVSHPGAASARNGGEGAKDRLQIEFSKKAALVATFIKKDSDWMPLDDEAFRNFDNDFKYGYAAIPHRDFAFGTNWRMGERGTTSNRRGSNVIQVFSKDGCYNNTCKDWNTGVETQVKIRYDDPKSLITLKPAEMADVDVPYESPKSNDTVNGRRNYSPGPGQYAKILTDFFTKVDYTALGAISHESFGHTGIYRGRLTNAQVLVVADQHSHDDMFSGRALTGTAGQKLQSLLNAIGAKSSYAIVRTLPVDALGIKESVFDKIVHNDKVTELRSTIISKILDNKKTKVIITMGKAAKEVMRRYAVVNGDDFKLQVVNLNSPNKDHESQWKNAMKEIRLAGHHFDAVGTYIYKDKVSVIPRSDLPPHTRWWMGTSGDRAARSYQKNSSGQIIPNGNYYKIYAPKWSAKWKATPTMLNQAEKASVQKFKESDLANN